MCDLVFSIGGLDPFARVVAIKFRVFPIDSARDDLPTRGFVVGPNGQTNLPALLVRGLKCNRGAVGAYKIPGISSGPSVRFFEVCGELVGGVFHGLDSGEVAGLCPVDDDCRRCPAGVLAGAVACAAIDALQAFPGLIRCGAWEFVGRERVGR